jgi:multidrug efflux system membrane fusion protein
MPATPVSVATVEQRDIALWDEFSGRLEAVERVEVRSRVAGAVQAVHFREGRAGAAGRPADHHRSGALCGRGRARAGAGRGRAGAWCS